MTSANPRQFVSQLRATLTPAEQEWKDKVPFLEAHGYRLRPRYRDGWKPSWIDRDVEMEMCEDWYPLPVRCNPHTTPGQLTRLAPAAAFDRRDAS